jgi:hypothetical protein
MSLYKVFISLQPLSGILGAQLICSIFFFYFLFLLSLSFTLSIDPHPLSKAQTEKQTKHLNLNRTSVVGLCHPSLPPSHVNPFILNKSSNTESQSYQNQKNGHLSFLQRVKIPLRIRTHSSLRLRHSPLRHRS